MRLQTPISVTYSTSSFIWLNKNFSKKIKIAKVILKSHHGTPMYRNLFCEIIYERNFHSSFWAIEFGCTTTSGMNKVFFINWFPSTFRFQKAVFRNRVVRKSIAGGEDIAKISTLGPGFISMSFYSISLIHLYRDERNLRSLSN